jgi:hypothetical protein
MSIIKEHKKFYFFDYFLDGYFLKSEEMIGEELPQYGELKVINSTTGNEIKAQIVDIEKISENEYKIFMNSSN